MQLVFAEGILWIIQELVHTLMSADAKHSHENKRHEMVLTL